MHKLVICILVASSLFLIACSDKQPAENKTVMDDQLKALEKAKGVEQLLQQSDEAHRKQMDEQSR